MKKKIVLSIIACLALAICLCLMLVKPKNNTSSTTKNMTMANGTSSTTNEAHKKEITIIIENTTVIVNENIVYQDTDTLSGIIVEKYEANITGGFLNSIGGLSANSSNHEYIAFYVNGEYSMVGVNDARLEEGSIYKFKLETW